jgi:hypothetical protein
MGESFDSAGRSKCTPFVSKITHPLSKIANSFYSDASSVNLLKNSSKTAFLLKDWVNQNIITQMSSDVN